MTGTLTEYPLKTADAQPSGIAIYGTDLWFTETAAGTLGFLEVSSGQMREFKPSGSWPPLQEPQDVAVISPGNPWFTEMAGDKITLFKWSTLQNFASIALPDAGREPYGIAVEDAVAVWFTERAGNRLGRYSGQVPPSEYPLPTPNSLPTDIVVDWDGCAWYTAPGANRIGRFCLPSGTYLPLVVRNWSPVEGEVR